MDQPRTFETTEIPTSKPTFTQTVISTSTAEPEGTNWEWFELRGYFYSSYVLTFDPTV